MRIVVILEEFAFFESRKIFVAHLCFFIFFDGLQLSHIINLLLHLL